VRPRTGEARKSRAGIDVGVVPGDARAPAQVEVVTHRDEARIEEADLLDELARHEQRCTRREENLLHRLVLALVYVSGLDAWNTAAVAIRRLSKVLKPRRIIPFEQLCADDARTGSPHRCDHRFDCTGLKRCIVVQEQERVGFELSLGRDLQSRGKRAPVSDPAFERDNAANAEGLRQDRTRTVTRCVVDRENFDRPVLLRAKAFEDIGQPGGPIGCDEQNQNRGVFANHTIFCERGSI